MVIHFTFIPPVDIVDEKEIKIENQASEFLMQSKLQNKK
jgi:hypothetical protein